MSNDHSSSGQSIAEAFIARIHASLDECAANPDQREARHQVQLLSELTRDLNASVLHAGIDEHTKPARQELVAHGRLISAATQRICAECDSLYAHSPPRTTIEHCAYCAAEAAQNREDP